MSDLFFEYRTSPTDAPVGHLRILIGVQKQHGSNGEASKPSCVSSDTKEQYQRYGASMRPYALLFNRHISWGFRSRDLRNSGTDLWLSRDQLGADLGERQL